MPYDVVATRARLIEAAIDEFAALGLAGARVDRIADAAAVNKRAIYDYFTNKEGLFEAAVGRVVGDLIDAVPLDEADLPDYAARLFDYLQGHREAVRMLSWQRLERPAAGPYTTAGFLERVSAVRDRPDGGDRSPAIAPIDLVILTIGLANAWHLSGPDLVASRGQDPADAALITAHRAAVIEAARRINDPN